jgi:hypothetical protein
MHTPVKAYEGVRLAIDIDEEFHTARFCVPADVDVDYETRAAELGIDLLITGSGAKADDWVAGHDQDMRHAAYDAMYAGPLLGVQTTPFEVLTEAGIVDGATWSEDDVYDRIRVALVTLGLRCETQDVEWVAQYR